MKHRFCLALALFALTGPAIAAGTVDPLPHVYIPMVATGQHNLATAAAVALTVPNGANYAVVQVKVATVNYTTDGTTPTTSLGMTLSVGSTLTLSGYPSILAFKAINASAASGATIDVEYYQ
jgi:hypothetical protein